MAPTPRDPKNDAPELEIAKLRHLGGYVVYDYVVYDYVYEYEKLRNLLGRVETVDLDVM